MSVPLFVFDICITFVIAAYLLYRYGNWMHQRVAVTISVLIAWYFSFIIIFILPLDVSNTAYKQCVDEANKTIHHNQTVDESSAEQTTTTTTFAYHPEDQGTPESLCEAPPRLLGDSVLLNLWRVVYWSSQLLTWLVLPLMQSFTQAGEFNFSGKLKASLWDNAIYYASYLFIALILVIYIAIKPDLHLNMDRMKAIVAAASNTWGLFVLVLMLGYGLVEVPRNLWRSGQRGYQLNRAYFKISKLMTEKTDAEEEAEDAVAAAYAVSQFIGQTDVRRKCIETIMNKIPLELMERVKRRRTENVIENDAPTEKTLIRIHRNVIKGIQNMHRTEAQWSDLTRRICELEDINRNMISNEHVFKRTPFVNAPKPSFMERNFSFYPMLEWYWKCLVYPIFLRGAAVFAAFMSVLIIWSEVTFFSVNPPLSLFAVFINLAKENFSYWAIEMISFVTICYLSICAYYTIFKIRVLNYYYLASNHQSDEYTLLFSGLLLCRLTPPLCLNFLSIIHMDSHVIQSQILETSYTQVMGHMDVISIVSDYFNIYFPIILLGLTLATYFNTGARVLTAVGFQQFLDQESEITQEMIEEGKEHMKREKRRLQRLAEAGARRGYTQAQAESTTRARNPILKDQQPPTVNTPSPERSLLQDSTRSPFHDVVSVETNPPQDLLTNRPEPPRNIFDDL